MTRASLPFLSFANESSAREPHELFAFCPSCGRHVWFHYRGVQRWSEAVAAACGLPSAMHLWTCESCKTTLSEPNLRR